MTCDNRPENPGHKFADRFYNVSITEIETIRSIAKCECADAVLSYASDVGAVSAANVSASLDLATPPPDTVETFAFKTQFREFLNKNGLNTPDFYQVKSINEARDAFSALSKPVFCKPNDSSGSKGVSLVTDLSQIDAAFENAKSYSQQKLVMLEENIVRSGYQIAGDGFLINGTLRYTFWGNEHFDKTCNGLVPVGESFPSAHSSEDLERAYKTFDHIFKTSGLTDVPVNFDFVFDQNGELYVLELGPRAGGNLIPKVAHLATGCNLAAANVEAALGNDVSRFLRPNPVEGYWSSYIVHSNRSGKIKSLRYSRQLAEKIVYEDTSFTAGKRVEIFDGSDKGFGALVLRFDDVDEMLGVMDHTSEHLKLQFEE